MLKRVSEIITIEYLKDLKMGDVLTIMAGTGAGKSYFIKNILYAFAKKEGKKILLLVHRDNCRNQFYKELKRDNKLDIIDLKTYQYLESHKDFDFTEFKYIVSDEFHYFIGDSAFNPNTDISLDMIMKTHAIKIFMSATGDLVKRHINKHYQVTIDFELPIDYNWIEEIFWFNKDKTINELCNECIQKNMKMIVFIDSAQKCYNIYKEFEKYSLFNCSKSNKLYKYVNDVVISNMLKNEKFDCNILFTTTCLDAGVNIIDDDLNDILLDVYDFDVFKQCIGRKRRKDNEKVRLYIQTQNNKKIGARLRLDRIAYDMVTTLEKDYDEFIEKYSRNSDSYVNYLYNCLTRDNKSNKSERKEVNKLMMSKILENGVDSEFMIGYEINGEKRSGTGYRNMLLSKLKFETNDYDMWEIGRDLEEEEHEETLEDYLESVVGKKIYSKDEEKKTLIKMIKLRDERNRFVKDFNTLSAHLTQKYNSKFTLVKATDWDRKLENGLINKNYGKVYWLIK